MGRFGWNVHTVPCREGLLHAAIDRWASYLIWRGSFSIDHLAAHNQRRIARFHDEKIGLGLMQFRLAIGLAVRQHGVMIPEFLKLLRRELAALRGQLMAHGFEVG